ncbi:MAG: hypothetical protein WCJ33_06100 [Pseudomonadota bacterium]|jgi:hypothetical protein
MSKTFSEIEKIFGSFIQEEDPLKQILLVQQKIADAFNSVSTLKTYIIKDKKNSDKSLKNGKIKKIKNNKKIKKLKFTKEQIKDNKKEIGDNPPTELLFAYNE